VRDKGSRTVYGGKISWLKPELHHNSEPETVAPKLYVIGSCMLVKKEVFEKIGFFDERYFLYFEDADFNVRAQKAGFRIKIIQEKLVSHNVSSSTKSLGSPMLLRYHYRNAHLFNAKNGPLWAKALLPFWSIYVILKQLLKLVIMPQKWKFSTAILAGVFDFYLGKFGKIV